MRLRLRTAAGRQLGGGAYPCGQPEHAVDPQQLPALRDGPTPNANDVHELAHLLRGRGGDVMCMYLQHALPPLTSGPPSTVATQTILLHVSVHEAVRDLISHSVGKNAEDFLHLNRTPEKAMERESLGEILQRAGRRALGGGLPGAAAMGLQVVSLMWLRTTSE